MDKLSIAVVWLVLCVLLAACGGDGDSANSGDSQAVTPELPTLVASRTPTGVPTSTNTPTATAQATATAVPSLQSPPTEAPVITLVPADPADAIMASDPPISITLPEDWQQFNSTQAINDVDGTLRVIPYTVYFGPVTGGLGQIILMWGFPSLSAGTPIIDPNALTTNLWLDGLRLLRVALFDAGCNFGTDVERTFLIGGVQAQGTAYSVVDCPDDTPPIRGWFAGVQQQSVNFVFFTGTEPIDAMDGEAQQQLQAILDTVEFRVDDLRLTPQP